MIARDGLRKIGVAVGIFNCVCVLIPAALSAQIRFSLPQAVQFAQQHDPWIKQSKHQQSAIEAKSIAAAQLPDPTVSVGFANVPADSFDLNQEPMTQLKLGVTQRFPRGDTRELERQRLVQLGARYPFLREDRKARVAVTVSHLWLDTYRYRESIRLIKKDRVLFEHLVDVAQSSYSSAVGNTRQYDLIRAQLELTRLDDRLATLHQQHESSKAQLSEWLVQPSAHSPLFSLTNELPTLALTRHNTASAGQPLPNFLNHPLLAELEKKINASHTQIALAKQQFKPQWGLNAGYAYRDDDLNGSERSDFLSVGITLDVPLFTGKRQHKQVQAAEQTAGAVKTQKTLLLRKMRADFEQALVKLQRLQQRKTLYQSRLLQETHEQAEALLTAYTNDDGDFADAVRARIAELNAQIEFLNIDIDRLKTIAQLNYFLVTVTTPMQAGVMP